MCVNIFYKFVELIYYQCYIVRVKEGVYMIELYNNIRVQRKRLGLTQTELAIKMGYADKSMIAKIESGKVDLPQSKIVAFAKALETSPSDLMGWEQTTYGFDNIHPIDKQRVPMLGEVACGKPIQCIEDRESYVLAGTEIDCDFCLTCRGDSMINARIHDGDIVFVKKMDMVENGDIAVVVIEDEATLKRFFYYPQKGLLVLKPENPKYEDLMYAKDELNQIHVLGKAIAFQSDVE